MSGPGNDGKRPSTSPPRWRRPGLAGDYDAAMIAVRACWQTISHQRAVKYQIAVLALTVIGGCWRGFGPGQWLFVVLFAERAISAEMSNTTFEAVADRITREPDSGVKLIKDSASGTVTPPTVAAVIAIFVLLLCPSGW